MKKSRIDMTQLCAILNVNPEEIWPLIWASKLPMPCRGAAGTYQWDADEVTARLPKVRKGFVYFLQCGEFIKIGFTFSLATRISSIRGSTPFEVNLLGYICAPPELELSLHGQFEHLRHSGEWFREAAELRKYIAGTTVERSAAALAEIGS